MKSDLNTNNITKWDEKSEIADPSLDAGFYSTFWGLQNFFQNPYLAFSTPEQWELFSTNMESILQALNASAGAQVASSNGDVNLLKIDETTFSLAKYLTSSKLIQLEVTPFTFYTYISSAQRSYF